MTGPLPDPRRERFAQEYLIDLNATQAAVRAGYSERTANPQAARLLANVSVAARIQELKAARAERVEVTQDRVLRELAVLGFSDIGQVLDFSQTDPHLRPTSEIPETARRAISSVKVRRYTEGKGDNAREVEITEFKLWDKTSALEKIARHLGMLKDTVEHTGPNGTPLPVPILRIERHVERPALNGHVADS